MTDLNDNGDEAPANDFMPDIEDDTDGDAPDFTLAEFDSDILASARLMHDPAEDAAQGYDTDFFDPESSELDIAEDITGDASYDIIPDPDHPETSPQQQDQRLLSIMSEVFGKRRAMAAARALMTDFRRALQAGEGLHDRAAALRWAVLRLARKSRRLDKSGANTLFHRLSRLFLAADPSTASQGDAMSTPVSRSELRNACSALRDAARHLLRVERRLTERMGGEG